MPLKLLFNAISADKSEKKLTGNIKLPNQKVMVTQLIRTKCGCKVFRAKSPQKRGMAMSQTISRKGKK